MCRNTLGVHRKATEILVKAELGRYPLMSNIIKHIYTYWQHVYNSKDTSILHSFIISNIEKDRNADFNYYSRIKGLLLLLDSENMIYGKLTRLLSIEMLL